MVLAIIFLLIKLLSVPLLSFSFVLYLLALLLLALESNELWTPIYYSIVSWWEYDFRYRDDDKVKVITDGEKLEARLTDLRKGAGCVVLFKEVKVGDFFHVELSEERVFKVEVMSKRYYSLGRPLSYGVRFHLTNDDEKAKFRLYTSMWRKRRKIKRKAKFEPV